MIQLQGPHLDKAEEVTDPILLNMAAAQLKTGEYALAAHNSTQVRGSDKTRNNSSGSSNCSIDCLTGQLQSESKLCACAGNR